MPSAGLDPAIPAIKRLQTYALDRTAKGISKVVLLRVTIDEQFHFPVNFTLKSTRIKRNLDS